MVNDYFADSIFALVLVLRISTVSKIISGIVKHQVIVGVVYIVFTSLNRYTPLIVAVVNNNEGCYNSSTCYTDTGQSSK